MYIICTKMDKSRFWHSESLLGYVQNLFMSNWTGSEYEKQQLELMSVMDRSVAIFISWLHDQQLP